MLSLNNSASPLRRRLQLINKEVRCQGGLVDMTQGHRVIQPHNEAGDPSILDLLTERRYPDAQITDASWID